MQHRILAGALAALALSSPAFAAGPADVTVRVEGVEQTLVPRTPVTTTAAPVNKSGNEGETCTGTSAAGALEIATGGDWTGTWYGAGFGYSVDRIKSETHGLGSTYYSLWLNNRESQVGVCGIELQTGDEVLLFVGRCDYSVEEQRCTNPPVLPLGIDAPDVAAPGAVVNVKVVEYDTQGNPTPVAGATVSGGDSASSTNADGIAAVTFSTRGERFVRATRPNRAPTESEPVCVTDGADGFCGTTRPGDPAPPVTAAPPAPDRLAPLASILGIAEQQVFGRAAAPRKLEGTVTADPSGLHAVKLRLTRRHRGRCSYFSKKADGFARTRCGRSFAFTIGDRADWSYLLPERLGPGRYVLDAVAIDKAFNRDALARGRNRVVFFVR
jgi:hypothetical protein